MRGAIPDPLRTGTIWLVLDGAVWTSRSVPGIHPLAPRAIKDSRQGPGRPLQWGVPPNGPNRRHNPRRFGPHVRAYASDCEQGARPSLLSLLAIAVAFALLPRLLQPMLQTLLRMPRFDLVPVTRPRRLEDRPMVHLA
ncbi:hypothetical protein CSOJ01_10146 [Colletotrichum sojae]|uniref:Uncharacterized protein n=1 Tax=Colletotrichum sojae TaxID=2175907 RepID=A0A8H6J1U1_9PEZI|nr:hypothetical protein CSOJ01_10146 [Colletotrichum sojae]